MPRLSLDISLEDQEQLVAMAAEDGRSVEDFVLHRALAKAPAEDDVDAALEDLIALLQPRLAEADAGDIVTLTAEDTIREGRLRYGHE